jgi:hypothetical protein
VYLSDVALVDVDGGTTSRRSWFPSPTTTTTTTMTTTNAKCASSSPVGGGRVIERSMAGSSGGGGGGADPRMWGLRDVGIACLRGHVASSPIGSYSALTTMIVPTANAVLSEYDAICDCDSSMSSFLSSSSSSSSMALDARPLVRDCVRTIIDLGSLPPLLEELIVISSRRLGMEGEAWGNAFREDDGRGGTAGRTASTLRGLGRALDVMMSIGGGNARGGGGKDEGTTVVVPPPRRGRNCTARSRTFACTGTVRGCTPTSHR